jgi:hypothetical protein
MNEDDEEEEIANRSIEDLVNSIFLTANFRRFITSMTDDVIDEIITQSLQDLEYDSYYNYGSFGTTDGGEEEEKREIEFITSKYNVESTIKECSICLVDFEENDDIANLTCKHIFHKTCIEEWSNRKAECPNCREPIS